MKKKLAVDMTLGEFLAHPNAPKLMEEVRSEMYRREDRERDEKCKAAELAYNELHQRYEEFCLKLAASGALKGKLPSMKPSLANLAMRVAALESVNSKRAHHDFTIERARWKVRWNPFSDRTTVTYDGKKVATFNGELSDDLAHSFIAGRMYDWKRNRR